jgi:predicted 2-oxoglutarate/Fe(II)-dependent dioxygenase YbiX
MRHVVVPDLIFTVDDFLAPDECARYIAISESGGYADAPITTSAGPRMRPEVRNNARVIADDPALAAALWPRLAPHVPARIEGAVPVGINERFRFYRYDPGQTFAWHMDGYYERDRGDRSQLTFMVYLNDGYAGGETNFDLRYPHGAVSVVPKAGMALLFVHHLLHEGAPLREGRKYVLRSDVMYSRPPRLA